MKHTQLLRTLIASLTMTCAVTACGDSSNDSSEVEGQGGAAASDGAGGAVGGLAGSSDEDGGGEAASLEGLYRVTSHTVAEGDCEAPQPVTEYSSLLYAVKGPFLFASSRTIPGESFKEVESCASAESCPLPDEAGLPPAVVRFFDPQGEAWVTESVGTFSENYGEACSILMVTSVLTPTESGLRLTKRVLSAELDQVSEAECEALAEDPPFEMLECDYDEEVIAERFVAE
ncbi:MAG: hypothetical protein ACE366_18660 [Bradymonadia bacterium]